MITKLGAAADDVRQPLSSRHVLNRCSWKQYATPVNETHPETRLRLAPATRHAPISENHFLTGRVSSGAGLLRNQDVQFSVKTHDVGFTNVDRCVTRTHYSVLVFLMKLVVASYRKDVTEREEYEGSEEEHENGVYRDMRYV